VKRAQVVVGVAVVAAVVVFDTARWMLTALIALAVALWAAHRQVRRETSGDRDTRDGDLS